MSNSTSVVKKTSDPMDLHRHALLIARVLQVAIICLTIGLFLISIPIHYEKRMIVCNEEPCQSGQLTARSEQALRQIGMTVDSLVKLTIAEDILIAAIFTISAIVIFIRKPNDLFTIFVTVMLVTFGVATFSGGIEGAADAYPFLHGVTESIALFGNFAIIAFLFVFPNGKFTPRWVSFILAGWILFQLPKYYFPQSSLNIAVSNPLLYNILFFLGILSAIATQVYRYRKVSNEMEKQQTKWVIYGTTLGIVGYLTIRILSILNPDPFGGGILLNISFNMAANLFILILPLSISVAVMRFRLWDIDPIINRTLVYGALSGLTIAFYVLVVGFFANYFQHSNINFIASFIATGVIAVLFEPLRERLQRGVNRLMYGESDNPSTVISRLGQRLEASLEPDSVLPAVVETVAQALKLPYVAIALKEETDFTVSAEYGRLTETTTGETEANDHLVKMPLTYQSEVVGELILAPRARDEKFSPADKNLLSMLSPQAGVAAHAIRLTRALRQLNTDLQQSREQLVTAREEERRRIRRDLHDGVGPILASLLQRLDTVRLLIVRNPEKAADMAEELKGQVKTTIADIRRLVYALRPPVLDELGLLSAIREYTTDYQGASGLRVTVAAPEALPHLSAAAEVAAYRIVMEAFSNVVRHAQATTCHITIKIETQKSVTMLCVEIKDNGHGLPEKHRSGVGIVSMRERTAELGGSISIESQDGNGTLIRACLPCSEE